MDLQDQGVIDSGCSRHMTGNMSYLTDYEEIDGGYVAFRGNPKGGKIIGKVAEKRNRTLIEAARTMLADSKLPTTFWAKAVNTACYVQNRVCPVTILNTIDHLGKFNGKINEGFFVGYSLNSKAFRVFNSRTRIVEENLHIRFSESTTNVVGTKASDNADPKSSQDDGSIPSRDDGKKVDEDSRKDCKGINQENEYNVNSTNNVNAASINEVNAVGRKTSIELPLDLNMPEL
ncbi:retrovirus-related pol polyprotein from transposon TNT 1-94, partial [Tanacetum coccineum]